jgi:hypothetical protein
MANRWFGPRPIYQPIATGWPSLVSVHGSCGCCACGATYTNEADELVFTKYPAYRDGLRVKVVVSGVPDSFSIDYAGTWFTEASGMSGYNGTWYFDVIRSQYGCIYRAVDRHSFDVSYRASDPFFPYDENYVQKMRLGSEAYVEYPFTRLSAFFEQFTLDWGDLMSKIPSAIHPMIAIDLEPTDPEYASTLGTFYDDDLLIFIERSRASWNATNLPNVISGNLRFRQTILPLQVPEDFDDPDWSGVSTFWDTATSAFKTAGTFTAEIERL